MSQAKAISKNLRVSPRKLNIVASMIRGMKVQEAIAQLTFCKRRISIDVKKCLQSAIANAENNYGLDIDSLFVEEATVGKAFVLKRFHARARGRGTRIEKFYSNLYITVSEG